MRVVKNLRLLSFLSLMIVTGCIGTDIIDDFVEARVALVQPMDVMIIGDSFQYQALYFDNIGTSQPASFEWNSSDPVVLEINQEGLAMAKSAGLSMISYTANNVTGMLPVTVFDPTEVDEDSIRMVQDKALTGERTAMLQTVSSYQLEGTATLRVENGLKLVLSDDFQTSDALPGLYVYLTNNVSTINNALEIGAVKQFSGAQVYEVPGNAQLHDYSHVLFFCKPFVVAVGNGKLEP